MSRFYIGRAPCGCIVAATINKDRSEGHSLESIAEFVSQMILDGLQVEAAEELESFDHLPTCQSKEKEP